MDRVKAKLEAKKWVEQIYIDHPYSEWEPSKVRPKMGQWCIGCGEHRQHGKSCIARFHRSPELPGCDCQIVCDEFCLVDFKQREDDRKYIHEIG